MISADEIIKLIEQGKSLQEISNLLDKYYYELRTAGYSPNQVKSIRNNLIYDLYKLGLDTNKICQIINNLNQATFYSIIRTYSDKELSSELKDEVTDERIYQLKEQGLSIRKIEEITGISRGKIDRRLGILYARKGKEVPKTKQSKSKRKTVNDEKDNKILEGLSEGKTYIEIAKELELSDSTISSRIKKMRQRGVEISTTEKGRGHVKTQNDETDNKILEGLAERKTQAEIAKELELTPQRISQRIKAIKERGIEIPIGLSNQREKRIKEKDRKFDRQLAKEIIKLIYTKHATIEQVKIMGAYYGVDLESVLNSLEMDER